jgi:hypothetical protein
MAAPALGHGSFCYADLCRWPEGERWELIDDHAYAMPTPNWRIRAWSSSWARSRVEVSGILCSERFRFGWPQRILSSLTTDDAGIPLMAPAS